ncbi:hypothetical protein NFI96_029254, partial [Prochilodus magdalenae]
MSSLIDLIEPSIDEVIQDLTNIDLEHTEVNSAEEPLVTMTFLLSRYQPWPLYGQCLSSWMLMDYRYDLEKCLLLLLVSLQQTTAASHSLHYITTATAPGIDFPEYTVVGLVDGEQFVYYDSSIRRMIPKTEWMKRNMSEEYWNRETKKQESAREIFKANVAILMKRFNQTEGVHVLQRRSGCELDDGGSITGYFQFGYDGEDFLILDMNTFTWTAAHQKAVITKLKWEKAGDPNYRKHYLDNNCVDFLKQYVEYGRSALEREVPPEVSLFQKDSSSPVVCHATGFYPKAVNITWQKNGEDLDEGVELREMLPNQDRTFQRRSILNVSAEELNKRNYTCTIQHAGLEKEMVLQVSNRRVLSGGGGGSGDITIGVVVAVLLLVIMGCVGVLIWRRRQA